MGLNDRLRKTSDSEPPEIVPFLDVEVGRVVQIPASELRPGAVQARLHGTNEIVWVLPEQLKPSGVKHPEFDEDIREYLRRIQPTFAEHRPLTFEEWEEGFRCDATPAREIAIWLHAADVYAEFAANEPDAARRRDVYRTLVTCMTTGPDAVWHVLRPDVLTREEAEKVVNRFFGKAG
jgi:hypothetical protein